MNLLKKYLSGIINALPVVLAVVFTKMSVWYIVPLFKDKPAPTPTEIVNTCVKTYKESGLTGLKILSSKSYSELNKKPTIQDLEKVAIIDMFSYQLDRSMANYVGFPQDEYFSVNEFHGRIGVYLKFMDLTTEEINKNIRKWEAIVNREITERFK